MRKFVYSVDCVSKSAYICVIYLDVEILSINRKMMISEITVEDVRNFLNSLNVKLDVYGMVFADRKRCQETMRMLGIN